MGTTTKAYWITEHARERLAARGISEDDLTRALDEPFLRRKTYRAREEVITSIVVGGRRAWLTVVLGFANPIPSVVTAYCRGIWESTDPELAIA